MPAVENEINAANKITKVIQYNQIKAIQNSESGTFSQVSDLDSQAEVIVSCVEIDDEVDVDGLSGGSPTSKNYDLMLNQLMQEEQGETSSKYVITSQLELSQDNLKQQY